MFNGQRAARRNFQTIFGLDPFQLARLPDRDDDAVAVPDFFGAGDQLRIEAPALVEGARHIQRLDAGGAPVLADDALGRDVVVNDDAFFFGLVHLDRIGQHLRAIFDDEAVHFLRRAQTASGARHVERGFQIAAALLRMAEAGRRARHIHRDVAAADDEDALAQVEVVAAEVDVDQEIDRAQHAVELFAFDVEFAAGVRADADEDGIKVAAQIGQREIAAQRLIEFERRAQARGST